MEVEALARSRLSLHLRIIAHASVPQARVLASISKAATHGWLKGASRTCRSQQVQPGSQKVEETVMAPEQFHLFRPRLSDEK